jgi:cytochrome c oxidase subunit 3
MTAHTEATGGHGTLGHVPEDPVATRDRMLLGVKLGILSEIMLFGALFAAYFVVRSDAPDWPPVEGLERPELLLPALNTILLVSSSVTMLFAIRATHRGAHARQMRWLIVTMVLGAVFLCIQVYEFATNGFGLSDGVFGSTFYTLTGFHGAHVLVGLLLILMVTNRARLGNITATRDTAIEGVSYYWHFVDVVWIFLFSTLYIL